MKIYPNTSSIMVTNSVNVLTDIPLSYIDTQKLDYKINTVIESDFKNKIKQEVLPYDKLNKNLICLFDKNGNQINYVDLTKHIKREKDDYIFMPYGSTTFSPKIFEYNVTAKKSIIYNSKMQYNINVCVNNETLTNVLMPIFGNAQAKGVAPSNILINNGSMSYNDLMTSSTKNKDILFSVIESLKDLNTDAFNTKTNIFNFVMEMAAETYDETVYMSDEQIQMYRTNEKTQYSIKKPLIYNSAEITSDMFFNIPKDKQGIRYHNIFNSNVTPILIEEHEGKGFIVYAVNSITHNISEMSKIMYEVMFYIYSKGYVKTMQYREWITDVMPDYIVVNNKLTKKERFVSQLELHKMFGLNKYEVTPYEIDIDENLYPFVKFTDFSDDYLVFEKDISEENKKYQDPSNERGAISIFTSRQNVVYFDEFLYKIDDSLDENMNVEKLNNSIRVTVKPYRHSSSGIYIKTMNSLEIPLTYKDSMNNNIQITNADFYIVCKQNESASYIDYKDVSQYTLADGLILATIQIRQSESNTLIYDMRQRGGGLPETEKDNYNCFDIGHIYGRPYRKGGTIVVTLPKKLEPHKAIIEETVKQYCAAEEYPIILFKED